VTNTGSDAPPDLAPRLPSPDSLVRQGLAFRAVGAEARAIEFFKQALAAQPHHLGALVQLAAVYIDTGKAAQALEVLADARAGAPNNAVVRRLFALCYLQRSDVPRARQEAEESVRLAPNDGVSHTVLGRILARRQDFRGAEAAFRRGAELAPDTTYCLVNLGYFLVGRRRLKDAAVVADDAGRAAPDDFGVLLLRGDVALRLGKAEEARDFALWALSQKATNREAIRLLVSVKARQNWFLGLWWRLTANIWLRLLLVIASVPLGLWFVPAIYLIAGRVIFDRMIKAELKTVKLKPGF
jgi:Tfp pilus assembly protein PilF